MTNQQAMMEQIDQGNIASVRSRGWTKGRVRYLGSLLWFTIGGLRITSPQVRVAALTAGLDMKYMPKPINSRDAFRRAVKAAETKRFKFCGDDKDKYLNLLVRQASKNDDPLVYNIVREIVDGANRRLEYAPVIEFILEKDNLTTKNLKTLYPIEEEAHEKVAAAFLVERDHYNDRTMRDVIMRALADCQPVQVRPSGGVYFIPQRFQGTVEALKTFTREISTYNTTGLKTRMWSVPVVNTQEQKDMLFDSLEQQMHFESERLIEEMAAILKSERRITATTAQKYTETARRLSQMVKDYEAMLETQTTNAQANVELIMQQAYALLDRVELE